MSLAALFDTPCTLYRVSEGAADEYGDPVLSADDGQATVCAIQRASTILRGGAEGVDLAVESTRWQVFLPADVGPFGGGDYLMIDGVRYDLDGDPWIDTRPRVGHVEVLARRVD
jgi:hypothetical protein